MRRLSRIHFGYSYRGRKEHCARGNSTTWRSATRCQQNFVATGSRRGHQLLPSEELCPSRRWTGAVVNVADVVPSSQLCLREA